MFRLQMQLKMYFVVLFVRPCMHHKYDGLSESDACKDCVWPIMLDAELYIVMVRRKQSKSKPEYSQNPEHVQRDSPGTN